MIISGIYLRYKISAISCLTLNHLTVQNSYQRAFSNIETKISARIVYQTTLKQHILFQKNFFRVMDVILKRRRQRNYDFQLN